jgi:hypothetical protein
MKNGNNKLESYMFVIFNRFKISIVTSAVQEISRSAGNVRTKDTA